MPNVVDSKLRDNPLQDTDSPTLLWFLNREIHPALKRILSFINVSWGQTVDVAESVAIAPTDQYVRVDASSGPVIVTLRPSSEAVLGVREVTIKKVDSSTNAVVVLPKGEDLIDGSSTLILDEEASATTLHAVADGYDILNGSGGGAPGPTTPHEPMMTRLFTESVTVDTNHTMLMHDPVLALGVEILVEGDGEVLVT